MQITDFCGDTSLDVFAEYGCMVPGKLTLTTYDKTLKYLQSKGHV